MALDQNYLSLQQQLEQLSRALGVPPATAQMQTTQSSTAYELVGGIEGARELLGKMLPSTKRIVFDKGEAIFYCLEKDANGNAAPITINRYTTETEPTPEEKLEKQMEQKYLTKADFAEFAGIVKAQLEQLVSQKQEVKNDG